MKILKMIAVCAAAATAVGAMAKSAGELRIYIDPGHGGYTGIDRPLPIIGYSGADGVDTIKFYESNTNLQKGLGVLEKLVEMGFRYNRSWGARNFSNNIVMSRNWNYETNLATVREEVDVNNIDMFLSIHSNAPGASESWEATNYPLMLYRGYTSPRGEYALDYNMQVQSREMSWKMWWQLIGNTHQHWTGYNNSNSAYISGDLDFYGWNNSTTVGTSKGDARGYLGVLRHHVPGLLSEGFFHTYGPARHRAMNWDVCRVEGVAYARGIADYFGLPTDKKGIIYGVVRDPDEEFYQDPYKHNWSNNDKFKPLNGVFVTLRRGNDVVARYATDDFYNGAFVFHVEPGTYTADFVCDGYQDCSQTFTVGANSTIYPEVWMKKGNGSYRFIEINYPDPLKDTGIKGGTKFDLRQEYVDLEIPEMGGRWPRRVFARNGYLYIMGVRGGGSDPLIIVYDPNAKRTVRNLSFDGITLGGARPIGDMALTADGYVVVCTEQFCQSDDSQASDAGVSRGRTRFYRWDKDGEGLPAGNPTEMFNSTLSGAWYRANCGHAFCYSGTLAKGMIVQSAINVHPQRSSDGIRYNVFKVRNGRLNEEGLYLSNIHTDYSSYTSLGELFTLLPSPGHPDYICINSRQTEARQYYVDYPGHNLTSWCKIPDAALGQNAYGTSYFRFGDYNYMVQPDNGSNGENWGIKLISCGDYGNATRVALTNWNLNSVNVGGYAAAAGEGEAERDDSGKITGGYINLYLVRDSKLTKFTNKPEKKPSAVEDIEAEDAADAPAKYYNLNGVEMPDGAQLVPGMYIRLRNGKAEKVIIK